MFANANITGFMIFFFFELELSGEYKVFHLLIVEYQMTPLVNFIGCHEVIFGACDFLFKVYCIKPIQKKNLFKYQHIAVF